MLKLLLMLVALFGLPTPVSSQSRYAEGQVWEYRTRPGDGGSLLKIQHIEAAPANSGLGRIYHISIVGLHIAGQGETIPLPHAPVSQTTLDASVIRLSRSSVEFPSADEGIAQWRSDRGGVFTISVAEIAAVLDRTLSGAPPSP